MLKNEQYDPGFKKRTVYLHIKRLRILEYSVSEYPYKYMLFMLIDGNCGKNLG